MTAKQIFGLLVRALGLVFVYRGLTAVSVILPMLLSGPSNGLMMAIITVGFPLCVAYWLLSGAPQIMSIAYPESGERGESPAGRSGEKSHAL